jgi:hypothetical protein
MTTTISPIEYCKKPEDFKNNPSITPTTRKYWDQYCKAIDDLSSIKCPESKGFGNVAPGVLEGMGLGLLSPEGLKMISMMVGGEWAIGKLQKAIQAGFAKYGLTKAEREMAKGLVKQGFKKAVLNDAIVSSKLFKSMAYVDIQVAKAGGYYAGRASMFRIVRFMNAFFKALTYIDLVSSVIQFVSIAFDAWDPCKLNQKMSASMLNDMTNTFNDTFRDACIGEVGGSVFTNAYGEKSYLSKWPVPFYAEETALVTQRKDYYDTLHDQLIMRYLNSLQFNSDGDPIYHYEGGHLITDDELKGIGLNLVRLLGSGNTVVENWFYKWWPIPVGALIFLIVVFIVIKGKKDYI